MCIYMDYFLQSNFHCFYSKNDLKKKMLIKMFEVGMQTLYFSFFSEKKLKILNKLNVISMVWFGGFFCWFMRLFGIDYWAFSPTGYITLHDVHLWIILFLLRFRFFFSIFVCLKNRYFHRYFHIETISPDWNATFIFDRSAVECEHGVQSDGSDEYVTVQ